MNEPLYLFCFARAESIESAPRSALLGLPEILVHREGDLAALLVHVSRDEFCGAGADERLSSPGWIARQVVVHSAVVDWAMRHSPVFPVRLGTLFSGVERISALMRSRAGQIAGVLERVDGKAEWAVKGWLDRRAAKAHLGSAAWREAHEAPEPFVPAAGTRYLRQRRLEAEATQKLDGWVAARARTMHAGLAREAAAFRPGPKASVQVESDELVANWAFLVDTGHASAFEDRARACASEYIGTGLRFELSGPWPPYSFCEPLAEQAPSWSG